MLSALFYQSKNGRRSLPSNNNGLSTASGGDRPLLCSLGQDNEEEDDALGLGARQSAAGDTTSRESWNWRTTRGTGADWQMSTGSKGGSNLAPLGGKLKYSSESLSHRRMASGLGWVTAALFIVADMAGGGVVAIPVALLNSGLLVGSLSIVFICLAFCYTAHILGKNWVTLCDRWPDLYAHDHCRKPYPEMAYRAMGERARFLTSCTINVMMFGVSVVYILLAAKIISELWVSLSPSHEISACVMTVVLACALLPVTFLKSPQDFWWAVVTAMLTTALSVLLILIGSFLDLPRCAPHAHHPPFTVGNYFLSIGIFFFAFGGHGVFPTIQHDMRRPSKFSRASVLAFAIVAAMYVPISYLGYHVYGDSLHDSIISSIQTPAIQQFANFFIALHCILTLTVVINPLNQEVEDMLGVPHHFGWQRAFVRTIVMAAVVFVALTIPSFGPILNLIGGTTVALTSAILPCLFNLFLHVDISLPKSSMEKVKGLTKNDIPTPARCPTFQQVYERSSPLSLAVNISVIVLAIICGLAATYSAILELSTSNFSGPCYLSSGGNTDSSQAYLPSKVESLHCCGAFRNITRWPNELTCPAYNQLHLPSHT